MKNLKIIIVLTALALIIFSKGIIPSAVGGGYGNEFPLYMIPGETKEIRRWNSIKGMTELMRSKENEADYRFIPDPDLPAMKITREMENKIKSLLPESPLQKLEKLIKKYKLNKEDAEILTKNLEIVELFEKVSEKIPTEYSLPWITVEWLSVLNYNKKTMDDIKINPEHIIELLELVIQKKITPLKAKEILRKFIPESFSPKKEALNSLKIDNVSELITIIREIIKLYPKSVSDYKSGEEKALNFLIGQVMIKTNKRADFQMSRKLLMQELK